MKNDEIKMLLQELSGIRSALEKMVLLFEKGTIALDAKVSDEGVLLDPDQEDALYSDARKIVLQAGKASTSYLQRVLGIGYARAAKLIDMLEEKGVIGPAIGSLPRRVIHRLTPEVRATLEKIEKQLKRKKK